MKRLLLILFPVVILFACAKDPVLEVVDYSDSGCGLDEMSPLTKSLDDMEPELILKDTPSGLSITRNYAKMNCSVKNGGMAFEVSLEGDVIHYKAYEKDRNLLRCQCDVKTMSSTISGLRPGRKYVLDYTCDHEFSPITFTYEKDMEMKILLGPYMP